MSGPHESRPALFVHYPHLAAGVPWTDLGSMITPIDRIAFDNGTVAWVKRDDHVARTYAGNKVRKLEFILGTALQRGAGRLITAGALGSHHALATSVYGAQVGLPTTAVLFPQTVTRHVREVVASHAQLRTILRSVPRMELVPAGLALARWRHRSERAYLVPPGGSSVEGALGFVSAGLELAEQISGGECPRPAAIYLPAGTLGTAAGLAIGLQLAGHPCAIVAVRVVGRLVANARTLRGLVVSVLDRLNRLGIETPEADTVLSNIEWRDAEIGRGYGRPTEAGYAAIERFRPAGIGLDPTYTGKAAAALLNDLDRGRGGPLLFWHTLSTFQPGIHPAPEEVLPRSIVAMLRRAEP